MGAVNGEGKNDYNLELGDLVLITDRFDLKVPQEVEIVAQYVGEEPIEGMDITIPKFITKEDETLYGFQTYWLPLGVANEARVKLGLEQIRPQWKTKEIK